MTAERRTDNSGVQDAVHSFAFLGAGEALARLIAFGTMLLVARRLGPSAYGVIGVASGIMLYLTQIADGGIELVGVPAIARARSSASELASATITVRAVLALALTALVVPIGLWVLPAPDGRILAIYACSLCFTALGTRWIHLGLERPAIVAVARVCAELVALALVWSLVHDSSDLVHVPIAAVISVAMASAVMFIGLRRSSVVLRPSARWARSQPLFSAARRILIFTLLGLVLFNFDLLFLRYVKGERDAGYYAAAYALISFAANVIVAYAHSVLPVISRADSSDADRQSVYGGSMILAFAVALPVGVGGALVAEPLVDLVFGTGFTPAAAAMSWLLLTIPIAALREMAVMGLLAKSGERALVRVNLYTVVANLVLNVALVPSFGLVGAAWATLITEVVRLALADRAAERTGFRRPQFQRLLRPLLAGGAMFIVIRTSAVTSLPLVIGIGVLSYGLALTLLGGISFQRGSRPQFTL
jgi:O-antigen/teichoic acid export membrane protein